MSWRFLATRLDGQGGEALLDPDLPLDSVKITHVLSGPTRIEASITPRVSRLLAQDGEPIFTPWSTAIYAEKDGVIRAGAILTDMTAEGEGLDLSCRGFAGYLEGLPFTGAYVGYGLDPLAVAKMIWNHVQSQPYGNLGMIIDGDQSPVRIGVRGHPALRGRPEIKDTNGEVALTAIAAQPAIEDQPYVLAWYKTSNLGQEFIDLAANTPFDYVERHYWLDPEGCEIQHVLDIDYPRIGKRRDDLRFVVGENVYAPPRLEEIGDQYASEVWVLGAGEGAKMAHGVATDFGQKRLRRVKMIASKGVGRNTTASTIARNELRYTAGRVDFDELEVVNTPFAEYGNINVGDEIFVSVGNNWYGQVDQWVRVVELSVSPDKGDSMNILVVKEDTD